MDFKPIPPDLLELNEEMQNHPALMANLNQYLSENPDADIPEKLGVIAAFCGIVVDGYYTETEMNILAAKCTMELRHARRELVLEFAPPKS